MKLAVIGCGYVGLVSGSCLAEAGHEVIATDNDSARIATLQAGKIPIYEPHLDKVLDSVVREGRLRFTADAAEAVREADVVFICVGTPPTETGEADLSAIDNVARMIAKESQHAEAGDREEHGAGADGRAAQAGARSVCDESRSEVSRGLESGIFARRDGGGGFLSSRPDRDRRRGKGKRAAVARVVPADSRGAVPLPGAPAALSAGGDAGFCGDHDCQRGTDQARLQFVSGAENFVRQRAGGFVRAAGRQRGGSDARRGPRSANRRPVFEGGLGIRRILFAEGYSGVHQAGRSRGRGFRIAEGSRAGEQAARGSPPGESEEGAVGDEGETDWRPGDRVQAEHG